MLVGVRDAEQRLQPAQAAVGAPVLGQFDGGAGEVAEFFQFPLESFEQGEGVRGAAGKAGEHFPVVQAPHFAGIGLHHALAQGDLPVAAHRDPAVTPHGENRRAIDSLGIVIHGNLKGGVWMPPFQAPRWRRARGCAAS